MKIRIASSIALAAGLALGATGCGMMAPQATTERYSPSDGIDLNVGDIDVRNAMLIADESGENFNVVFSTVNATGAPVDLSISFVGEGSAKAQAEFTVPTGSTEFGNPEGDITPVLVTLPGVEAGATVSAYFQVAGAAEVPHNLPVLNGELKEYRAYVLPENFGVDEAADTDSTGTDSTKAKTESAATEEPSGESTTAE